MGVGCVSMFKLFHQQICLPLCIVHIVRLLIKWALSTGFQWNKKRSEGSQEQSCEGQERHFPFSDDLWLARFKRSDEGSLHNGIFFYLGKSASMLFLSEPKASEEGRRIRAVPPGEWGKTIPVIQNLVWILLLPLRASFGRVKLLPTRKIVRSRLFTS